MARYIDADKFEKEIRMEASESIADAVIRILDRQPTAGVGRWQGVKVCKTKPSTLECNFCRGQARTDGKVTGCRMCDEYREEYELVGVYARGSTGYAIIIKDGCLEEVEISRVFGIRDDDVFFRIMEAERNETNTNQRSG